jgi:hypothetical protein
MGKLGPVLAPPQRSVLERILGASSRCTRLLDTGCTALDNIETDSRPEPLKHSLCRCRHEGG